MELEQKKRPLNRLEYFGIVTNPFLCNRFGLFCLEVSLRLSPDWIIYLCCVFVRPLHVLAAAAADTAEDYVCAQSVNKPHT